MARQSERARASWKGTEKAVVSPAYDRLLVHFLGPIGTHWKPLLPAYTVALGKGCTVFEGYQENTSHNCVVMALVEDSKLVEEVPAWSHAELVLDHTPFYAESGGQVGDTGKLLREGTEEEIAIVEDTYSPVSGITAHKILAKAPLRVGDRLTAVVDAEKRNATRRNHTATHVLHAALRQVLGPHVKQAGSVVEPSRLRFDFSHFAPVDDVELEEIENLANAEILKNIAVQTEEDVDMDQALESGAWRSSAKNIRSASEWSRCPVSARNFAAARTLAARAISAF